MRQRLRFATSFEAAKVNRALGLLLASALTLAACGETDPPSPIAPKEGLTRQLAQIGKVEELHIIETAGRDQCGVAVIDGSARWFAFDGKRLLEAPDMQAARTDPDGARLALQYLAIRSRCAGGE